MKRVITLCIVLAVISCKSTKQGASVAEDKFKIEPLAGMTVDEIKEQYPDAKVKEDIGMFDEATVERPFTILYPDTANEIQITWKDSIRTEIHDIRIKEAGQWKTSEGIKIGTTYEELNKLNGKKISFYGFGWDYSGAVVWNGGALEDTNLRVFLAPGKDLPTKYYGDYLIEATPEEIVAMDLSVRTILYQK